MINRSTELERLYDLLMSRESVLIYAPSGMGKSVMVKQLTSKLEGRRFSFEINVRGLQTDRQLLHRILKTITDRVQSSYNLQYQLKRIISERPAPTDINQSSLAEWFKSLLVGLQDVSLDFLFIFEDIDQWEGKSNIDEFLKPFCRSRNSHALITSSVPLEGIDKLVNYNLASLTIQKINDRLIADDIENRLPEILKVSDGNTRFFKELIDAGALTSNSVEESLVKVLDEYHTLYYNFRGRFTDLQWRLLLAIATEERVPQPHSFDFLVNYRLGAASSVERALRNLSDTNIIRNTDEGWRVSQIRFQRWIQWLYPQNVEAVVLQ